MILYAEYGCPLMEIGEVWRNDCEGCEWHGHFPEATKECAFDRLTRGEARHLVALNRRMNRKKMKIDALKHDIEWLNSELGTELYICRENAQRRREADR